MLGGTYEIEIDRCLLLVCFVLWNCWIQDSVRLSNVAQNWPTGYPLASGCVLGGNLEKPPSCFVIDLRASPIPITVLYIFGISDM